MQRQDEDDWGETEDEDWGDGGNGEIADEGWGDGGGGETGDEDEGWGDGGGGETGDEDEDWGDGGGGETGDEDEGWGDDEDEDEDWGDEEDEDEENEAGLIVDDDAPDVEAWQMTRSAFVSAARGPVWAALAAVAGSDSDVASEFDRRFASYASMPASALEARIQSEVPGAGWVPTAAAYIPLIAAHVASLADVSPGSPAGDGLLAHEVAHTLYQRAGLNRSGEGEAGEGDGGRARSALGFFSCNKTAPNVTFDEKVNDGRMGIGVLRIPPRVGRSVQVKVGEGDLPVDVSVKGGGGPAGNATVTGGARLTADSAVTVTGTAQTTDPKASGLRLVATVTDGGATREIAESNEFRVSALPLVVHYSFENVVEGGAFSAAPGKKVWAAIYKLSVESDSGDVGDLDQTWIFERVVNPSSEPPFSGRVTQAATGMRPTSGVTDAHGFAGKSAADVRKGIKNEKARGSQQQVFAVQDDRTGGRGMIGRSGFEITEQLSVSGPVLTGAISFTVKKVGAGVQGGSAGVSEDASEHTVRLL